MAAAKRKPLTPAQKQARREADARRYKRDKEKRIAAVREQEKKDPDFKAKRKARAKINNAVRDGKIDKPEGADFHHTTISKEGKGKGRWVKGKGKGSHRRFPNSKDAKVK